ncbi:putative NADH dehydrogenase [ubiquinone] 1 alpha subcomplex subunit 5 [Hypsibius exemplaris]|uniref:NADH dehydrogenase [ubiquinone] 1 alpha subcomplex subunit 5 n=1 Tax=Hypsibius exemplaris TaxID=2072580 RepID=A0A9X6NIK8_HYPEX|nr:putative NADH dehydrogenase [ubiquinone] 1 alpha subcomplex subunit 5 [Hypsibius exemplaris]
MAATLGGTGARVAGVAFRSTGLTRLEVSKIPHHTLTVLYGKTLRTLQKMPEESTYRQSAERIVKERLDLVTKYKDPVQLEQKINAGLLEEVILHAEYELMLARNFLEWKPWEPLISEPPPNQWQWPVRAVPSGSGKT